MNKLLPIFAGVACFLWVTGWTWIIAQGKSPESSGIGQPPISLLVNDQPYEVQQPFAFKKDGATPIVDESLHPALESIAARMGQDRHQFLHIVGVYQPIEQNGTSHANLGLARAEAIKSMLIAAGADGERIVAEGLASDLLFQQGGNIVGAVYFRFSEQKADKQAIAEPDLPKHQNLDDDDSEDAPNWTFEYQYGNYKVEKGHKAGLIKLQRALKASPNSRLTLTGYSSKEEEAASDRINLAEMRALYLRRYLIDHGVRRSQIETASKPGMSPSAKQRIATAQITIE